MDTNYLIHYKQQKEILRLLGCSLITPKKTLEEIKHSKNLVCKEISRVITPYIHPRGDWRVFEYYLSEEVLSPLLKIYCDLILKKHKNHVGKFYLFSVVYDDYPKIFFSKYQENFVSHVYAYIRNTIQFEEKNYGDMTEEYTQYIYKLYDYNFYIYDHDGEVFSCFSLEHAKNNATYHKINYKSDFDNHFDITETFASECGYFIGY